MKRQFWKSYFWKYNFEKYSFEKAIFQIWKPRFSKPKIPIFKFQNLDFQEKYTYFRIKSKFSNFKIAILEFENPDFGIWKSRFSNLKIPIWNLKMLILEMLFPKSVFLKYWFWYSFHPGHPVSQKRQSTVKNFKKIKKKIAIASPCY